MSIKPRLFDGYVPSEEPNHRAPAAFTNERQNGTTGSLGSSTQGNPTGGIPTQSDATPDLGRVRVSIADALPLLMHAVHTNKAWVEDFAADSLDIPADLYEVLIAYKEHVDSQSRAA